MLDESTRNAILKLHANGMGARRIAKAVGVSRGAVKDVLKSGSSQVPKISRPEVASDLRETIVELHEQYGGHLGRVHEELLAQGAELSYPTLTAYCRRHGIGYEPKRPSGRYDFLPGEEMQHDTSPHRAIIRDVLTPVTTASAVMCFCRKIFFQCYPRFRRFECKCFLSEAIAYFGGACGRCMVDNSNVIVASGTGAEMIPAPEMAAFGERYSFTFVAHEKGDANRSARVEGPFDRIERAFLKGSRFESFKDLNDKARARCDLWNAKYSPSLGASREELFQEERARLKPLPAYIPPVYLLHTRMVDAEGYIALDRVRYSVPWTLIDREVEVRETIDRVEVFHGKRMVANHPKSERKLDRVTDPAHRPPKGQGRTFNRPPPEIDGLKTMEPRIAGYVDALAKNLGTRRLIFRRLYSMVRDYPRDPLLNAVLEAEKYGLFDLDRLERMVLKKISRDYFPRDSEEDVDE